MRSSNAGSWSWFMAAAGASEEGAAEEEAAGRVANSRLNTSANDSPLPSPRPVLLAAPINSPRSALASVPVMRLRVTASISAPRSFGETGEVGSVNEWRERRPRRVWISLVAKAQTCQEMRRV